MHQTDPANRDTATEQAPAAAWSYDEAFSRHRGLISQAEQQKLRASRVAIAGMGGVGGVHLMTLVRLGIGKFTIADPDTFELANFNRQFGATATTLGRNKAEVMAERALAVNPELEIRVVREPITEHNVGAFLHDADVFLDGLDFFEVEARRLVFSSAREQGIWAVTAGPIGMSVAWLVFDPRGMSFEDYFDFDRGAEPLTNLIAFAVGLTPKAAHRGYMDLSSVDLRKRTGPSTGAACELCAGVAATEIAKLLLSKGTIRSAPEYSQFDAFTYRLLRGRLWRGNRGVLQRMRRRWLQRALAERLSL